MQFKPLLESTIVRAEGKKRNTESVAHRVEPFFFTPNSGVDLDSILIATLVDIFLNSPVIILADTVVKVSLTSLLTAITSLPTANLLTALSATLLTALLTAPLRAAFTAILLTALLTTLLTTHLTIHLTTLGDGLVDTLADIFLRLYTIRVTCLLSYTHINLHHCRGTHGPGASLLRRSIDLQL